MTARYDIEEYRFHVTLPCGHPAPGALTVPRFVRHGRPKRRENVNVSWTIGCETLGCGARWTITTVCFTPVAERQVGTYDVRRLMVHDGPSLMVRSWPDGVVTTTLRADRIDAVPYAYARSDNQSDDDNGGTR